MWPAQDWVLSHYGKSIAHWIQELCCVKCHSSTLHCTPWERKAHQPSLLLGQRVLGLQLGLLGLWGPQGHLLLLGQLGPPHPGMQSNIVCSFKTLQDWEGEILDYERIGLLDFWFVASYYVCLLSYEKGLK